MNGTFEYLNKNRINKVIQLKEAQEYRINRPCTGVIDPCVKICTERAELITESYRRSEGNPWILRRALALEHLLKNMTIYIQDGEQIVGNYASTPESLPTYPEWSYRWLEKGLSEQFSNTLDETGKKRLKEINRFWATRSVESIILSNVPEDLKDYLYFSGNAIMGTWFWPMGMMVPDYGNRLFRIGLRGLIKEIHQYREGLTSEEPEYEEKSIFYDAAEISAEAVIKWIYRYAALARQKSESTSDAQAKEGFLDIAKICSFIAENPPQKFHEALQLFYFCHLVTTQISWCSVGLGQRFDQLFYPFYIKEKKAGNISYERAVELFKFLWIKLDDLGQINPDESCMIQVGGTKFQNVTIGGVDENGNDATNELSFAILDATIAGRTLQPSLCLRYHDKINKKLLHRAMDCIRSGMGMPSIFNDKIAIKKSLQGPFTIFPETVELLGLKWSKPLIYLYKSKTFSDIKNKVLSASPGFLRRTVTDIFNNWLYRLCTGESRFFILARKISTIVTGFDHKKILLYARNFASVACVGGGNTSGFVFQGSLTTIITSGVLNFLKCIEYVMYMGIEPQTGKQAGAVTPDPRTFKTYDEFLNAFLMQIEFAIKQNLRVFDICDKLYQERTPRPFASLLMNTPVMRGRDATHRGDSADCEIFTMAPVNAADSLAAIKKLVFEEQIVTMDDLIKACDANFEGYEYLHKKCLGVSKFGNDDDYVDLLMSDMYEKVSQIAAKIKCHYGVSCRLEATLAGGYFAGGLVTGATPDGRKKHETVSDGQLSPMHGRDLNGPTAVLKSCSKIDPLRSWNQLCNQKIHPTFLENKNKKLFEYYLKTWANFGNWHIQFNCQKEEDLREAIIKPEKHVNLIVRVAGYSARFIDLTPGLQRDIIRRTQHRLNNFNSILS